MVSAKKFLGPRSVIEFAEDGLKTVIPAPHVPSQKVRECGRNGRVVMTMQSGSDSLPRPPIQEHRILDRERP